MMRVRFEAGAHDLRLAAEGIGILYALVALEMGGANGASGQVPLGLTCTCLEFPPRLTINHIE